MFTTMPSSIKMFSSKGRERQTIASELDGALLISHNPFPYYMLIAFEAGSPIRALTLLLAYPFIFFLKLACCEEAALRIVIFVSTAGLRVTDVKAVAKATLPRFYLADLRESAYKAFSSCGGEKYVITSTPRIMVEPFLREYLDVDRVIATELRMIGAYCSGLVASPGIMAGGRRLGALKAAMGKEKEDIDVGIGSGLREHPFMQMCREHYIIRPEEGCRPLPRTEYPRPLIFHDGRFAARPTSLNLLTILLWLPLGILTAIIRILVGTIFPHSLALIAATGIRIRAQFHPSSLSATTPRSRGTLYVCSHRTLLDPVFISFALQRKLAAVTYSVSPFSERISPIPTVRLTRDRARDGETMRALLNNGDLVVCPEGTTCREPYLLRFSPLFAEVADDIVPVAVVAEGSMFYGTTVRGYKCLDSFFFLMNPRPCYRLVFLERVQGGGRRSSYEVANGIQRSIGRVLGFECTSLTRRDKYRMIAGTDGVVENGR